MTLQTGYQPHDRRFTVLRLDDVWLDKNGMPAATATKRLSCPCAIIPASSRYAAAYFSGVFSNFALHAGLQK